jgi:hypothetical protein
LFTRELARRLESSAVTANCGHPGLARTRFGREARLPMRAAVTLARTFMLSPRRGARTIIVYLASSPQMAGATGGYYVKSQLREPSPAARDDAAAHRLWQLSEELTGLTRHAPPGHEGRQNPDINHIPRGMTGWRYLRRLRPPEKRHNLPRHACDGSVALDGQSSTPVPSVTAIDGPAHQGELGTPRDPVRCSAMCLLVNTSAFGAVWMAW